MQLALPSTVPAIEHRPAREAQPRKATGPTIEPLALRHELLDFDRFPIAPLLKESRPGSYRQCVETMAVARDYGQKHLAGSVERWDQEVGADHAFVPWAAIDAALRYRFLSINIPTILGGGGLGALAGAVFMEEISAADAGVCVIFGAHGLALAMLGASLEMRLAVRLGREICAGEKRGQAVVLALAHSEPSGGSDVEDVGDIKRARFGSRFVKVPGGYRVTARKVFISNGSIARYNLLTACGDTARPLETMASFLIPHDAPGFRVGRVEHKMGQRLSTAAEVICDDVFVPEADAVDDPDPGRTIETTLSLTRGSVGAIAAGIIRGTLERTLVYLSHKRVRGHWLFEEQHVTLALADMLAALQAARDLYMDAALVGEHWGLQSLAMPMPRRLPGFVTESRAIQKLLVHPKFVGHLRAKYHALVPKDVLQRLVGYASIAKLGCSDLAVSTAMKAMEILGEDANDPRWGVEKCMRDAKLTQIFEGTNQINRLHATRGLVRRGMGAA
jgi:butyryl-CoA dehydrogenase